MILIVDIENHKIYKNEKLKNTFHVVNFKDLGVYPEGLNVGQDNIQNESKDIYSYNSFDDYDINLPEKLTNKFIKELTTFITPNPKKDKSDIDSIIQSSKFSGDFNKKLGEEFFYTYLANLFQNYYTYIYNDEKNVKRIIANEIMNKTEEDINIENLFNVNQYLHDNKNDSEFYTKFFKTRIFKNFIIRKYLNESKDKYDFLRFDEKILEKK